MNFEEPKFNLINIFVTEIRKSKVHEFRKYKNGINNEISTRMLYFINFRNIISIFEDAFTCQSFQEIQLYFLIS